MARIIRSVKLETRTARRAIRHGKAPVWQTIERGRSLGYRSGLNGGTWLGRFYTDNFRCEEKLGAADDTSDSDGVKILNYAQALQKANEFFLSAIPRATGQAPHSGPYTVSDAIAFYLKHLEQSGKRDLLHARYDFNAHVIPQLGKIHVRRLNTTLLEKWRTELANSPKRSNKKIKDGDEPELPKPMTDDQRRQRKSTANRIVRRLTAALNYAHEQNQFTANATSWRIRAFKGVDTARPNFLDERDQQIFVRACAPEKDFQDLVLAALHSGCRYSELGRLRVKDFVLSGPSLFVEISKPGKSRHIFLDGDAEEFFRLITKNRSADEIMLVRSDGNGWGKDDVKKPMRRALKAAKMTGIQFHSLRHSFATRLLTSPGGNAEVARKALGHSNARMIEKHYGHLTDVHMKGVMAALPSAGLNRAAKDTGAKVVRMRSTRKAERAS
jgi:integrase